MDVVRTKKRPDEWHHEEHEGHEEWSSGNTRSATADLPEAVRHQTGLPDQLQRAAVEAGLKEFRSLTLHALHVLHGDKDRNANQTMEREQIPEWQVGQTARAVELYQKHFRWIRWARPTANSSTLSGKCAWHRCRLGQPGRPAESAKGHKSFRKGVAE